MAAARIGNQLQRDIFRRVRHGSQYGTAYFPSTPAKPSVAASVSWTGVKSLVKTLVMLVSDEVCWFDVLTAKRGDFAVSVLTALLGELPLAVVLIVGSLRIARLQVSPSSRPWWPFPRRARSIRVPNGRKP
jgi:hypothetical protein